MNQRRERRRRKRKEKEKKSGRWGGGWGGGGDARTLAVILVSEHRNCFKGNVGGTSETGVESMCMKRIFTKLMYTLVGDTKH